MAIIWNQPPAPDFFPIETTEEIKERMEASMDDMETILAEAEEDEDSQSIIQEIEAMRSFAAGKGFGRQ
jgi:hypothetical protein